MRIDLHTHESIAALVAAHPARFAGMATVPLQDPALDAVTPAALEGGNAARFLGG